ncbi:MAG: hypothetical protein H6850_00605 [Alphaproteobacteria bacterium]|nr:MAG: hypothetical protein H6850_00605 [Alphaproteobacteria bacterium]
MTLAFCIFRNKLYVATSTQSYAVELDNEQDVYKHLPAEKYDGVVTPGGPYPFTRMRIFISTAYGYAQGYGIPCHLIKRFDFLGFVFPNYFLALETRRGDFFTYHQDLGEAIMSEQDVRKYAEKYKETFASDADIFQDMSGQVTFNLAEKLLAYYPIAKAEEKILKEPYYMLTPEYKKTNRLS